MSPLLHPGRRPDIDGLRAVSVLAVLGFHAFPQWVPWGFVGVDVFFVISGYLITTILLENLAAGRFTFAEFYARRIRRIFPALIVVLVATLAMGWHFLLGNEMRELGRHVAAGGGFVSNLLLWSEHGYFDREAATKPLLHLWSLGIEEQFYIVWPLVLWSVRRSARMTLAACVVLPVASFAAGAWLTTVNPVAAFYSPLTRGWELLGGGALAWVTLRRPAWLERYADARSAAALALFVAGAVLIDEKKPFPGLLALLPVGAALLWISARGAWLNERVLAQRTMVGVGLVSYPLYLWHWPLLVFAGEAFAGPAPLHVRAAMLLLSLVLAWGTYRFVERPLRFGAHGGRKAIGLALAMLVVIAAGGVTVARNGFPGRFPPMVEQLMNYQFDHQREWRSDTCFLTPEQAPAALEACPDRFGARTVLLWGDSHAAHLYPGLRDLLDKRYSLVQRTASKCPPMPGIVIDDRPFCRDINARVMEEVRARKPEVVLLAAAWAFYPLDRDLEPTLAALREAGVRRVILVGPMPLWEKRMTQLMFQELRQDPLRRVPTHLTRGRVTTPDKTGRVLQAAAAKFGAEYVDPLAVFCAGPEGCIARVGDGVGDVIGWDRQHLTVQGSRYFVSRLPLETVPAR